MPELLARRLAACWSQSPLLAVFLSSLFAQICLSDCLRLSLTLTLTLSEGPFSN